VPRERFLELLAARPDPTPGRWTLAHPDTAALLPSLQR